LAGTNMAEMAYFAPHGIVAARDLKRTKYMLRIAGFVIAALSALVLALTLRRLWNAQGSLRAHGINKPIPLDAKSRRIIGAWAIGLAVGIALIAYGGE
jgi:hypothetical protein